jgi:hypothetical protein
LSHSRLKGQSRWIDRFNRLNRVSMRQNPSSRNPAIEGGHPMPGREQPPGTVRFPGAAGSLPATAGRPKTEAWPGTIPGWP